MRGNEVGKYHDIPGARVENKMIADGVADLCANHRNRIVKRSRYGERLARGYEIRSGVVRRGRALHVVNLQHRVGDKVVTQEADYFRLRIPLVVEWQAVDDDIAQLKVAAAHFG